MTAPFSLTFKPDLTILPFKASIRDTGQPLTYAQAQAMLSGGQAESVRIERSYPGAPEALGWTLFERTPRVYVHTGDPLFAQEREACRHMYTAYAVCNDLNGPDATTYSHARV